MPGGQILHGQLAFLIGLTVEHLFVLGIIDLICGVGYRLLVRVKLRDNDQRGDIDELGIARDLALGG